MLHSIFGSFRSSAIPSTSRKLPVSLPSTGRKNTYSAPVWLLSSKRRDQRSQVCESRHQEFDGSQTSSSFLIRSPYFRSAPRILNCPASLSEPSPLLVANRHVPAPAFPALLLLFPISHTESSCILSLHRRHPGSLSLSLHLLGRHRGRLDHDSHTNLGSSLADTSKTHSVLLVSVYDIVMLNLRKIQYDSCRLTFR
jgi:hypothetical protein